MNTIRELKVALTADINQYNSQMDKAEERTRGFSGVVGNLGKAGGAILGAGLAGAGVVAAGFGVELVKDVQAAADAQTQQTLLNSVLKNTGNITGVTSGMVNNLAGSLSLMTQYEDDSIVSAGAVIARFKEINSDSFPQALSLSTDLATALKMDLGSAALMVSKAIATPGEGLLRLKQAGVVFTDQEEKMIGSMMEAGKTAEAQKMIMDALQNSVGGAAQAAGQTAAGQWAIFQNQIGNIRETIGGAVLPALTQFGQMVNAYLAKPETQAFIQGVADAIGNMAQKIITWLPQAAAWIKNAFQWLMDNKGVIVGVLAAIGVAIVAFAVSAAPAIWAVIAPLLPVIAIMAAVAAVAYLVYEAWTNNWGGIRDTLMGWWAAAQPIIQQVVTWFQVNIPIAIQAVATWWNGVLMPALQTFWAWLQTNILPVLQTLWDYLVNWVGGGVSQLSVLWNGVLLPAIQAVWSFISGTLWPLFQTVANFLGAVFGVALSVLAAIWNKVLLPAITIVWDFISGSLWPLFQAIGNFLGAVFGVALTALAGIWQNVLLPAIQVVAQWIGDKLQPIFQKLSEFVNGTVMPVIREFGQWMQEHLAPAIQTVADIIADIVDWINDMTDALKNIKLPDWMTPGSPTPWELGLRGIRRELEMVSGMGLPDLQGSLAFETVGGGQIPAGAMGLAGGTTYNLTIGTLVGEGGLDQLEARLRQIRTREDERRG